jgi:hypothetical protein
MTKLSESIVGKIKQERIAPVPRWHFLFKSYIFWSLLGISILLGSLSFSVIAHIINNGDIDLFTHLQGNFVVSTVILLPFLWFFSLIIFAIVAYYNWKHTKLGYKFKRRWMLGSSIVLSMSLGSVLYAFGMGNALDRVMVKAMPFYDVSKHKAREELWLKPESGLIMGKVLNIDSINNQFVIQDVQGVDWKIDEKAISVQTVDAIKTGKIVKIIGKKDGANKFIANEIRSCGDCQDDEDQEKLEGINDDEEKEETGRVKGAERRDNDGSNNEGDNQKEERRERN